jgi:proteasome lid subunit RPN8/RPN11
MPVICTVDQIRQTLEHLRHAGRRSVECVVLWLGRRSGANIQVVDVYRPVQTADEDMFHIPPEGMQALHKELRARRLMVAAQIHSHPERAFHSQADDRWAIIRHEGALSLVVPDFAAHTTGDTFRVDTKVFQFSGSARWVEVAAEESHQWLQVR